MSDCSIKLVCFDLGGVLVRTTRDWQDAFRRASIDLVWGFQDDAEVQLQGLADAYETGCISESDFTEGVSGCNRHLSPTMVTQVIDAWLDGLYAGVDQLIDRLAVAGYTTACLSNTNDRHWRTIITQDSYLALKKLDHRYASHLIGARKPDPEAYEHVERALGLRPDQVLFFDDLPPNVDAARHRGWVGCLVDRAAEPIPQVIQHLHHHDVL